MDQTIEGETEQERLWQAKYALQVQELEQRLERIRAIYNPLQWELDNLSIRFAAEYEERRDREPGSEAHHAPQAQREDALRS